MVFGKPSSGTKKTMSLKKQSKFRPGKDRVHYGGAFIDQGEVNAVVKSITHAGGFSWTIGGKGTEFEKVLSAYTKHKYTVLANSGSSALLLAILALDLPKGSVIALPATCFPTALSAIQYAGHKAVLIDSDPRTFNLDVPGVEQAARGGIAALIAVAIAGNIPEMDKLKALSKKYKFKLILDNCDGFGGKYDKKPVESWADVACTSFHAAHIISMGEGGAVFTSDRAVADRARQYRDWGREGASDAPTTISTLPKGYPQRYAYPVLGMNLKPLELQAAVGLVQFKKLEKFKKIREFNFATLTKIFGRYPGLFMTMESPSKASPCWFSFPVYVRSGAREFSKFLESKQIETRPIFAGNIYRHPIGKDCFVIGNTSGADDIMEHGMFIGLSPRTTPDMLEWIDECVEEWAKKQMK